MDFAFPTDHKVDIKESDNIDEYTDLVKELKKTVEHEDDGDTNGSWSLWNHSQKQAKRDWWNWRSEDHCVVKINMNTQKTLVK